MAGLVKEYVIPYTPRDAFKPFHNRKTRWACLVAHRRAGKTVSCINDLIRRAFSDAKENGRYAYIAPYHSQAKSIAWDYLLRFSESVRLAMGLNGGVVMLGQRTSKFTKPQFAEWIEFLYATAADRGVKLPAWEAECAA